MRSWISTKCSAIDRQLGPRPVSNNQYRPAVRFFEHSLHLRPRLHSSYPSQPHGRRVGIYAVVPPGADASPLLERFIEEVRRGLARWF